MTNKKRTIDDEIQHVVEELGTRKADSEEYGRAVKNLEILCQARSCKTIRSISIDTIVMAATNLLGILLILNYEQLHVIGSKSLGFILKGRV